MTSFSIAWTRALVGLAQGVALYLLYRASEVKGWPATEPLAFAALLLVAAFVPLIVVAGLANMRARTLTVWALVAAVICAGLAVHDILRDPLQIYGRSPGEPRIVPTLVLWPCLALILFVGHALIVAGEADRRFVASYPRFFDVSWKHGVQLALAAAFVGAFWTLLLLSAELFRLIGIRYLLELIERPWFYAPATTVTLAYALHATDARAELVRGVRTLALTLLAWLLPMLTAFAIAFLLALSFTGLQPLWNTRQATATLLVAAAALIFLINAAYQDGQAGTSIARVVRYARSVASLVLVPVVGLAAYGLMLRAQQHGWTPERIVAGACVVVAACYAIGYALAALRPNFELKGLEPANIIAACVVVAVVLALFSPVADPARTAVADQLRRLESGQVSPEKFDFKFLRFQSGRYGKEALERLAAQTEGAHATAIAERAKQAQRMRNPWEEPFNPTRTTRTENIAVVYPPGHALPASFVQFDWWTKKEPGWMLPPCLTMVARCEAALVDLDGDGTAEVLLIATATAYQAAVFKSGPDGGWAWIGGLADVHCPGVREALKAGQLKPVEPRFKEIEINNIRLRVMEPPCVPAGLRALIGR
jgi:Domain of unknown function (DUF4153)